MSHIPFIQAEEVEPSLSWAGVCDALVRGHRLGRADIDDILFRHDQDSVLNRAAWVRGLGIGVKTATIFPGNEKLQPAFPNIHAVFTLFDDRTGVPVALVDGNLVTKWKTVADSLLGARFLARPDSTTLLLIGAGSVASSLLEGYADRFPSLERVLIWNRTAARARRLARVPARDGLSVESVEDLASGVARADIVAVATMAPEPVLSGEWVIPGTHVDLVGAFRPDMREADDALISKAEVFVDSRETAVHDIGELLIPIRNGIIGEQDVRADLYDLCGGAAGRSSPEAVTVYKNGGGAHLDLMTAKFIFDTYLAGKA
jgi:ornithine cyclodeaminase